jgi:hypothetical protein
LALDLSAARSSVAAYSGIRLPRALSALHLVTPSHVKLMSASIPTTARMRNRIIDGSGMCRSSD